MSHNQKNQYDKKDSLEIGNKAESLFVKLAKARDWQVEYATNQQDMNEHWDYQLSKQGTTYLIDVKARKRINRGDTHVQDDWVWIELHGVRPTDQGWLFGGKADLIAFERAADFIIVKSADLRDLMPKLVEKTFVKTAQEAKYKLYRREGRRDIITLIKMSDLESIVLSKWNF